MLLWEEKVADNMLANTKPRERLEFLILLCAFSFVWFRFFNARFYGGDKMVAKEEVDVIYLDSQGLLIKSHTRDDLGNLTNTG